MARKITSGMELTPSTDDGLLSYFEGKAEYGTVTRSTAVKRSGTASRAHDSGTDDLSYTRHHFGAEALGGKYTRVYFRVSALPSVTTRIMWYGNFAGRVIGCRVTAGGKLQLWNEVTGSEAQIGSDSGPTVAVDNWYRLELYGNITSGTSDQAELRLDGQTVAASTQAFSDAGISDVYVGWLGYPGASKIIYLDDLAINDDTGASQNSWPGDGKIVYLNPVSDYYRNTEWTAGAGATTNLWDAVNNNPPSGVAAASATNVSQIKNVAAIANKEADFSMESYTTAGLVSGDVVTLVQAVAQMGSSSTAIISGGLSIISNPTQAGAADSAPFGSGSAIGAYGAGWRSNWGTAQVSPSVALGTQPAVFLQKVGTEVEAHCCGVRLAVEYTLAVAGGGGTGRRMALMGVG